MSVYVGQGQIIHKILSSVNPFLVINPLPDICSGSDTSYVSIGYDLSSTVVLNDFNAVHNPVFRYDSMSIIPDGPLCASQCYSSSVDVMAFGPETTVTSTDDILSICVNMEHSHSVDLTFRIICPNGQSVTLAPHSYGCGTYMGEPYGGGGHNLYDNGCDPVNNPFGTGWTYCWSEFYPQQGALDTVSAICYNQGIPVDSTNTINDTDYLTPNNSLSGLFGCPLNGVWTLDICDYFAFDNGYVFWWEINLNPSLFTAAPPIDTVILNGPFINVVNDSLFTLVPDSGGNYQYVVTVIDSAGNSYDTSFSLIVIQTPIVDFGPDNNEVCLNYLIDAGPADAYYWSTGNTGQTQIVTQTGYYWVNAENYNTDSTLTCWAKDTVYLNIIDTCYYGINDIPLKGYIRFYPALVKDLITIEFLQSNEEINVMITICDIQGKSIVKKNMREAKTEFNISRLTTGIYYLIIQDKYGIVVNKIVKE